MTQRLKSLQGVELWRERVFWIKRGVSLKMSERRDTKRIKQIVSGPNDMRRYVTAETAKGETQWESRSRPLVADDLPRLRVVGMDAKLEQNFYLDEKYHDMSRGKTSYL